MLIKKMCPFCGLENVVEMPDTSYAIWQAGVPIQDAWPHSTPAMREAVLTGSHEHCWAAIWLENYDMEDTTDEILSLDISDIPHFIRNALYPETDTIIPSEYAKDKKAHIEGGFD